MTRKILLFAVAYLYLCTTLPGQSADWPVFRGTSELTGKSAWSMPDVPALLWTFNSGSRSKSSPVISDGVIYFGTDAGSLVAVNADGKLRWKSGSGSSIEAPPLIQADRIIYSISDGSVRSADKSTGRILWTYKTGGQIAGSANFWNVAGKSGIVVGSYDFYLHCINPLNGKVMWKVVTENYVNGTPAISSGKVVFGGCDGVIRIVDLLYGKETDTIMAGVYIAASPAISYPYAFIGDYEGTFYKLDIKSGTILWKRNAGDEGGSILSGPAISGNRVLTGSDDNSMYCFDSATGKILWRFRTNGSIAGSAAVSDNRVLFGSNDGYVYLLDLTTGEKKWSFNCGAPVSSTPAMTRERFYVLTSDGRLIAFGTKK